MSAAPTQGACGVENAWLDRAAVIVFVALLLAPLADLVVRPGADRSTLAEMRQPAALPEIPKHLAEWSDFADRFEAWHNDHFGLRDKLMRWHNWLKIFAFKTSPSPRVVIGRDQWVFSATERQIDVWRGAAPLTEEELEAWRRALESRRNYLAARGITFLFALTPSKPEIYPEFLPSRLRKAGPTRVEQLVAYLEQHSDVRVLDLRPALLEEKKRDQPGDYTYFPLGVHWNQRGALAATRAIVERLAPALPAVATVRDEPVSFVTVDLAGDSWAQRLYLEDVLTQTTRIAQFADEPPRELRRLATPVLRNVIIEQDDASLPRALVFHDSFAEYMWPLLPRHFSHTRFVWKPELDLKLVESEHPDVVMQIFNDRVLVTLQAQELDADRNERLPQVFDASKDVLLRYDVALNDPAISVYQEAELEVRRDADGVSLACRLPNERGAILLPVFAAREGMVPIAKLELESPIATTVDVLYKTRAQPSYKRTRQLHFEIAQGRNTLYIELLDPDFFDRLVVRPGREAGTYLVRSLEARAVPR